MDGRRGGAVGAAFAMIVGTLTIVTAELRDVLVAIPLGLALWAALGWRDGARDPVDPPPRVAAPRPPQAPPARTRYDAAPVRPPVRARATGPAAEPSFMRPVPLDAVGVGLALWFGWCVVAYVVLSVFGVTSGVALGSAYVGGPLVVAADAAGLRVPLPDAWVVLVALVLAGTGVLLRVVVTMQ